MADDQDKLFQSYAVGICGSRPKQAEIWAVINIHEVSTLSPVRPH